MCLQGDINLIYSLQKTDERRPDMYNKALISGVFLPVKWQG